MAHSPVQGETISFATAPATIWRKYYEPTWNQNYHDNQKYYLWHFLLNNKAIYSNGRNGKYLDYNKLESAHFDRNNDINRMRVGIHADVPVVTGCGGDIKNNGPQQIIWNPNRQNQKVTLALVSAFNMAKLNKFKNGHQFKPVNNNGGETFAKIALDAAYEGTIHAAIAKGKKRVFLTIMGGGSFRNDIAWIYESIAKIKDLIRTSGLQVTLIFRPDDIVNRQGGSRSADADKDFLKYFAWLIDDINNGAQQKNTSLDGVIDAYCNAAYSNNNSNYSQEAQTLQRSFDNLASGQLSQKRALPYPTQQSAQQVSQPAHQFNNRQIPLTARVVQAARPAAVSSTGSTPQQQQLVPAQRSQVSPQAAGVLGQLRRGQSATGSTNNSISQSKSSWIGWTFKWFVQKPVEWLLIKPIKWLFNIK
jgi:hypothetical protein